MSKKIKKIYTDKLICTGCGRHIATIPKFFFGDLGEYQCPKCGATGHDILEGRPIGRKSEKFKSYLEDWELIKDDFDDSDLSEFFELC